MGYSDGVKAMIEGCNCSQSSVSGFFTSKDEVHWYIRQTNHDIEAFRQDVVRWSAGKSGDDLKTVKNFIDFYSRWRQFYITALGSWWSHDLVEQTDAWRHRLNGWRRTFMARGMKPVTADPEIPKRKESKMNAIVVAATGALLGAFLTEKFIRR